MQHSWNKKRSVLPPDAGVVVVAGAVWVLLLGAAPAAGQLDMLRPKPTVFENARIISMAGGPVDGGSLVVAGGKVQRVGKAGEKNDSATVIDLKGRTVTPGFIDVDGALAMTEPEGGNRRGGGPPTGSADPTNLAFDNFDRYATESFKDALRNGVTAVYISARAGGSMGITGTGAVVRLMPGDGPFGGEVVKEQAALCIDLGSENPPLERLQTLDRVRRQFRAAVEYREALDTYKDDLEEYEKKIKERADKAPKDDKAKDEKKDAKPPEGKKPEEAKPEKKEEGGPPPPKKPDGDFEAQPERRPVGPPGPQDGGGKTPDAKPADAKPGEAKKEDDLKKPVEPVIDRKSAVLLKAIDREVPVRVRCERSEDIANALELAAEFSLRVVIDGGAESYLVGKDLAAAKAPVVLGRATGRGYYRNDALQRRLPEAAAVLSERGVEWHVGSGGGDPLGARFVLMNAQLTAGEAGDKDPLALVTTDAADFLGVGDKMGRLSPGRAADFVVWSGDPLDPASRVEEVYVGGELVYRAPESEGGGK